MSRLLEVARRADDLTFDDAVRIFNIRCVHSSIDGEVGNHHLIGNGTRGIHASVLRSYQVLELVKGWLGGGVPPEIILELIGHIEELADHVEEQRPLARERP